MQKLCGRCQQTKPLTEYNKSGVYCRACAHELQAASRAKNVARHTANPPDPDTLQVCSSCKLARPGREFGVNYRNKSGFANRCKDCSRKNSRVHRAAHVEKNRAQPPSMEGTKRCPCCEQTLARTEFGARIAALDGLDAYCRPCRALVNRARNYGLSIKQLEQMAHDQGGRCACCKQTARLNVDHHHGTKQVRALLCSPCNLLLGFAREDESRLRAAISYLRKHATLTQSVI